MQEGMVADIVMFDPKTVTDNATYEKGTLPSTGIPHAIVNGIIVMKDSVPLERFEAGQPIRFEVQEKGRFTPLSKEIWEEKYYGQINDGSAMAASPLTPPAAFTSIAPPTKSVIIRI
jgi:hypothetical protein